MIYHTIMVLFLNKADAPVINPTILVIWIQIFV